MTNNSIMTNNPIMIKNIFLLLVIVLFFLPFFINLFKTNKKENFSETVTYGSTHFSDNFDLFSRKAHKYPFADYSLYGYDDYYPVYRYYDKYGYPDARYWSQELQKYPWKEQSQLRPEYPVLAGPELDGLPSYSTRYHYKWPSPIGINEQKIRNLGKSHFQPKKL